MSRLLALLLVTIACASNARAQASVPAHADDELEHIYIEIGSAYAPLSACMRPLLDHDLYERASLRIDPKALARDAATVLGSKHPAVLAADDAGTESRIRVQKLGMALALFAQPRDGDPMRVQLHRAKATMVFVIHHARFTDGKCVPSPNLLQWLDQVPLADA